MNRTLQSYLENQNTLEEWAARFQIPQDRTSMIRAASVMPMVAEIQRMAQTFGMDPLGLVDELRKVHAARWDAIRKTLKGRPSAFRIGRQGRAPKL